MRNLAIAASTLGTAIGLAVLSAPAVAQSEPGDRVNMVTLYGDDECPQSEGDTITVCARFPESERFRIPPALRGSNSPENEAWTNRAQSLETVGAFGPLSCTPVGAGGQLGCTAEMIQRAYEEREQGSDVRFSQLIAEERAARLSEIDGEAAATQARVEELERAYMERLEAERDAELPGEGEEEALPEVVSERDMPASNVRPPDFSDEN